LSISTTATNLSLDVGKTFAVDIILGPAAGSTLTSFQSTLVYDPACFNATLSSGTLDSDNFDVTATSKKTSFVNGGKTLVAWQFVGARAGSNTPLVGPFTAGTVTLTRSNVADGSLSTIFLSHNGSDLLTGNPPSANNSRISSSPTTTGMTYTTDRLTVKCSPGPSSLLVFAMGGVAPIMGLVRRRRARA
jgi:hypothetical protein